MSTTVGELDVKLKFDSKSLSASMKDVENTATAGASKFGSAWTVAAGVIAADALKKLASVAIDVGKQIVQTGMNYEKAMSEVKAISGATAEELDMLSKKGIQSASTSVFTTAQTAEAYKYMGMAGWKAGEMIEGLDGILNLAAASNLDLGRTSDIVTDALTAFGYAAKDSAHFADVLSVAATNSNTNVDMLGESFKYVGSVAGAMQYSIEDIGVALGLMANSGVKASQAGTSLRSIISRMAAPTTSVRDAMETLGLSITDAEGNVKPFNEVMLDLRRAFAGLTEQEKVLYASTIAGKPAMSGLLAIVNAGEGDFNQLTEAMANADGKAQEMAETMLDNLAGAITMVQSSWDAAMTSLYSGDFSGFAKQFGQAVDGLEKIIQHGAKAIAEVLPKTLKELSSRLPSLASTLGTALIEVMYGAIEGLAAALPNIVQAALNFFTSVFNQVAAQAPTLISSVVTGIIDALLTLTNPENLTKLLEAGLDVLQAVADGIIDALPILINALPEIIDNIVIFIIENLPTIIEKGMDIIFALTEGIANNIPAIVGAMIEVMIRLIATIVEHLPEILAKGIEIIVKLIAGILQMRETLFATIGEIAQTIVNKIAELPGRLYEKGKEMIEKLGNAIGSKVSFISSKIKEIFDAIVNKIKAIPGEMLTIGKDIVEGLWNGINSAKDWLFDKIGGFASSVVDSVKGALGINSPSRIFRDEVGVYIAEGIGVGFAKAMPQVAEDMQNSMLTDFQIGANIDNSGWTGQLSAMFDEPDAPTGEDAGGGFNIEKQIFNINSELDADDMGRRIMASMRRTA